MEDEKAEFKTVTLELSRGRDGHWLHFESSNRQKASINLENKFHAKGTVGSCIHQWAKDQFKAPAED